MVDNNLLLQTLARIEGKLDAQNGRMDAIEIRIVEHETRRKVEIEMSKKVIVKWGMVFGVFTPVIASLVTFILTKLI